LNSQPRIDANQREQKVACIGVNSRFIKKLFQYRKPPNLRADAWRINMKNVNAVGNVHPVARDEVPRFLAIVFAAVVLERLHEIAADGVEANRALTREMDEINPSLAATDAGAKGVR